MKKKLFSILLQLSLAIIGYGMIIIMVGWGLAIAIFIISYANNIQIYDIMQNEFQRQRLEKSKNQRITDLIDKILKK